MLEHDAYEIMTGSGDVARWLCVVTIGPAIEDNYVGCGPTKKAAEIDAFEKASHVSEDALFELGVRLGLRGDGKGGRPYLHEREGL